MPWPMIHAPLEMRCSSITITQIVPGILSHDTLCHCLSSNSSLENSKRELGHRSHYCRNCKNTLRIGFRERAYSQQVTWSTAFWHSSPDPSLSCCFYRPDALYMHLSISKVVSQARPFCFPHHRSLLVLACRGRVWRLSYRTTSHERVEQIGHV